MILLVTIFLIPDGYATISTTSPLLDGFTKSIEVPLVELYSSDFNFTPLKKTSTLPGVYVAVNEV